MQTVIQPALMYAVDQDVGGPKIVGTILISTRKKSLQRQCKIHRKFDYLTDSKGHNYHKG